jgi:hypothetical protein
MKQQGELVVDNKNSVNSLSLSTNKFSNVVSTLQVASSSKLQNHGLGQKFKRWPAGARDT